MSMHEETKVIETEEGNKTVNKITYSELKRVIAAIEAEITSIKVRLDVLDGG